jgi:hypothetical protein
MSIYSVPEMSDLLIEGFINKIKEDKLDIKQANLELYLDNTMLPERIGMFGICKVGFIVLGNSIDTYLEHLEPKYNPELLKEDKYLYIQQYNNIVRPIEDTLIADARLAWHNYLAENL